ncbi:hypothetical protein [Paenibacillus kobensis]|uniref:hypothetical protein n=1 Tax=Paenibacillus kobensis TaxID=59841 RepID=UPI000FD9E76E|nr:hypothetical protein [Paenibacillus kobensis]
MNTEQARENIAKYIEKCRYTYKVDDIIHSYLNYYKQGYYVSYTMKDCISNLKDELELLTA